MDGYLACLREGLVSGLVPARLQADEVAKQADKQTDPATSTFLTLGKDADLPATLRADLDAAGAAAAASYAKLASFLRDELAPAASETDAVGRERYGRFSRLSVGAAVDLDEPYDWGLEELARLVAEQNAVLALTAGPGTPVQGAPAGRDLSPINISLGIMDSQ